jgi:hypothetical protein
MGEQNAKGGLREATIEAVVIRADGTRENLGVVSYWHKNPAKRAAFAARQKLEQHKNRSE